MTNASKIRDIVLEVLYTNEEMRGVDRKNGGTPEGAVLVRGISQAMGFHPERLLAAAPALKEVLKAVVADEFFEEPGGSFLSLAHDREGRHWAEHPTMETMVCLAIGLGWAHYSMPRVFWRALPGGVPLIEFHFDKEPKLLYALDLDAMKTPRELDEESRRRHTAWTRISEAPSSAVIGKELFEEHGVDLEDIRQMTPEQRVWVLTNAGSDPKSERVMKYLKGVKADTKAIFA